MPDLIQFTGYIKQTQQVISYAELIVVFALYIDMAKQVNIEL